MKTKRKKQHTIADEAKDLVYGDRSKSYGDWLDNASRAADIYNAWRRPACPINAEDINLILLALKMSREAVRHKQDNLVDIIGYTLLLDMLKEDM